MPLMEHLQMLPSSHSPRACPRAARCPRTSGQSSSEIFDLRVEIVLIVSSAANLPADCINLGQGYMNFPPPQWVKEAADEALNTVAGNHYSHPKGRLRLREAIRDHYSPLYGRKLDVEEEIIVSSGANEGKHQ